MDGAPPQTGSRGWAPMTGTHRGLTSYGQEINRCYLMPEEWAPCPFSTAPSCHKRCPLQSQEACEGTPPPTDSVSQAPPIKKSNLWGNHRAWPESDCSCHRPCLFQRWSKKQQGAKLAAFPGQEKHLDPVLKSLCSIDNLPQGAQLRYFKGRLTKCIRASPLSSVKAPDWESHFISRKLHASLFWKQKIVTKKLFCRKSFKNLTKKTYPVLFQGTLLEPLSWKLLYLMESI